MIQNDFSSSYNTINFPVYVMARCAGSKCNLSCAYCKNTQSKVNEQTEPEMNRQTLERFIKQYIDAQIHAAVHFYWTGGEPLLCGVDFYEDALTLQKRLGEGKHITNTIETNATLLTDEWCAFLKSHDFKVTVLLDGPQHCHDKYKTYFDGRGSFDDTMKGIALLRKHGIRFQIKATIHNYNVDYPLEIYRFFKANNLRHIEFVPYVAPNHSPLAAYSVPAVAYGNFLCTIFDEWIRHDIGKMFISIFENTLKMYCQQESSDCIYAPTCGHNAMSDSSGNIYSCTHFYAPEHKIGNIQNGTITGMMYSRKQLRFGQQKRSSLSVQCKRCNYLRFCNGGCPKDRIGTSSNGEKHHNILCAGYQKFFGHASPAMIFMAEEISRGGSSARVMSYFETSRSE